MLQDPRYASLTLMDDEKFMKAKVNVYTTVHQSTPSFEKHF